MRKSILFSVLALTLLVVQNARAELTRLADNVYAGGESSSRQALWAGVS